jgi:hypothetical protein
MATPTRRHTPAPTAAATAAAAGPVFYLGTHQPHWLTTAGVPLFVSHRRLAHRRTVPRAAAPWALDSGGFTELSLHGTWTTTAAHYAASVRRYRDDIGHLQWAAPRDWMCEPQIIARTGLSVAEHQRRTLTDFLELRTLAPDLPFIPVLQGWRLGDYPDHAAQYAAAGIDLTAYPVVGVGTVCRRQNTTSAHLIFSTLARETGLPLHGFGVKTTGLTHYQHLLTSADSLAWSYAGRREPGCTPTHTTEANCLHHALAWRSELLARLHRSTRSAHQAAAA